MSVPVILASNAVPILGASATLARAINPKRSNAYDVKVEGVKQVSNAATSGATLGVVIALMVFVLLLLIVGYMLM